MLLRVVSADVVLPRQVMVKMDHCVVTVVVTACLWLVNGDDYLLVFWQARLPPTVARRRPSVAACDSVLDRGGCRSTAF